MPVTSLSSVPECEVQWDSGSEVGIVGDGSGGAREVCSVAGVNGSHKEGVVASDKVDGGCGDVNIISTFSGQVQDSQQVVLQVRMSLSSLSWRSKVDLRVTYSAGRARIMDMAQSSESRSSMVNLSGLMFLMSNMA